MPIFKYIATNPANGDKVESEIEAVDQEAALGFIQEQGLAILSLEEKKKGLNINLSLPFLNRVTMKHLVIFSRQFAVMLKATVPVVQTLKILVKQTANPVLKMALGEIADEVDGGMKLSQALAQHPKIFNNFFVAMIKSGETSGRLDEVLEYLADQQEKDYDLMSKIKGAMIYPAFIVCGLFAVGVVMMVVVIPKLTAILQESGGQLPFSTRMLIGTSNFMSNYWWALMIIILFLGVGIRYFIKTPQGKGYWDWLLIKMPVFGNLFKRIYLVRLTRSLATLSNGGLPLVEALEITSQIVDNKVYCKVIDKTITEVQEGNTIASVFIKSKDVPAMVSYMISVGEQTGRLDLVLEKLSNFYAREIDNLVANLVSLIEPIIMVILGVAVGVMVAAIIMPMYNLASNF
jgi:type IV pilus assembly protein PilC